MKNTLLLNFLFCIFCTSLIGQSIYEENFESGILPSGFTVETNATDNGWKVGSAQAASSAYFQVQNNGSAGVAYTNDDACNCNKSMDRLILPVQDLSNYSSLSLNFDSYFTDNAYQGAQEEALVQISTDAMNWVTVEDVHGHGSWDTHRINISEYAGQNEVYISFLYNDNGGWLFGFAIDNISIEVPSELEVELVELNSVQFLEIGEDLTVSGSISNNGASTINEMQISYSVNGMEIANELLDNLSIPSFSYAPFELNTTWTPDQSGDYSVQVRVESINGQSDNNPDNNEMGFDLEVYPRVQAPNIIRDIMNSTPMITTVANAGDQLVKPTDLDFHPVLAKDELWIVNERTENEGGSTLTIFDASSEENDMWLRVDGNAWHFMSLPTGIAFSSDNYNFATSPGVLDANHQGGSFTGPTLWSSDPEIYAQPSGGNGSHLDMLHGSPYSMGIAHEVDNVFWVYDNFNKSIVRYDFVEDHGPGNDDHSDAIVRRFNGTGINADGGTPNHMILDKESNWLYIVDNGNDRVMRLDIESGASSITLQPINEALAEHSSIQGFSFETIIDGLDKPCGIEIIDDLLLVGEYDLGDIIIYDMNNDFEEIGRIYTNAPGLTGLKVGPDGSLWYTNYIFNTVNRIQVGESTSTQDLSKNRSFIVSPNPSIHDITISIDDLDLSAKAQMELYSVSGALVKSAKINSNNSIINIADLNAGVYIVKLIFEDQILQKKIIINR